MSIIERIISEVVQKCGIHSVSTDEVLGTHKHELFVDQRNKEIVS